MCALKLNAKRMIARTSSSALKENQWKHQHRWNYYCMIERVCQFALDLPDRQLRERWRGHASQSAARASETNQININKQQSVSDRTIERKAMTDVCIASVVVAKSAPMRALRCCLTTSTTRWTIIIKYTWVIFVTTPTFSLVFHSYSFNASECSCFFSLLARSL